MYSAKQLRKYQVSCTFITGDSSRCARGESDKPRQKIREGVRNRIYSRTLISVLARHPSRKLTMLKKSSQDMSQVALITTEKNSVQQAESSPCNLVVLEVRKAKNGQKK